MVFARCRTIWNIGPASSSGRSERVDTCFLGITRQWPIARGLTSRNARNFASSYIFFEGICPVAILQNMQSVIFVHLHYDCLACMFLLSFFLCRLLLLLLMIRILRLCLILSSFSGDSLPGICLRSCS